MNLKLFCSLSRYHVCCRVLIVEFLWVWDGLFLDSVVASGWAEDDVEYYHCDVYWDCFLGDWSVYFWEEDEGFLEPSSVYGSAGYQTLSL
jgi:hypothetical protein